MNIWSIMRLWCAWCLCCAVGCDVFPGERSVLEWEDGSGLQVTVVERFSAADISYEMVIVDGATRKTVILCDKIPLQTVSLIEYQNWLLVLSGDYVIGGYNRTNGDLGGISRSAIFPFTVRVGGGKLLATAEVGTARDDAPVPRGLQIRYEKREKTGRD